MTAAELTCEVLDRRNIRVKDKEYWNCWEVSDKEDMGEKERTNASHKYIASIHFCTLGTDSCPLG